MDNMKYVIIIKWWSLPERSFRKSQGYDHCRMPFQSLIFHWQPQLTETDHMLHGGEWEHENSICKHRPIKLNLGAHTCTGGAFCYHNLCFSDPQVISLYAFCFRKFNFIRVESQGKDQISCLHCVNFYVID